MGVNYRGEKNFWLGKPLETFLSPYTEIFVRCKEKKLDWRVVIQFALIRRMVHVFSPNAVTCNWLICGLCSTIAGFCFFSHSLKIMPRGVIFLSLSLLTGLINMKMFGEKNTPIHTYPSPVFFKKYFFIKTKIENKIK